MKSISKDNILVWLPSPMGDAILCTPALRAIRGRFQSEKITFLGSWVVRQVLSPCGFTDEWLDANNKGVFALAGLLRKQKFNQVILFKNSFGSALACFLAGIPVRIGYAREGRGIFLTDRLNPPKLPTGNFKPVSVVDYYLAIASWLGADTQDRRIELSIEPKDAESAKKKLPQIFNAGGPVVILVPGAAGTSKRWPADRFAKLADWLTDKYKATVVLSIAPNADEKQIAQQIVEATAHKPVNLGDSPVSLGELKALFAVADLVIGNDTGPRHIAIGLKRKVITLVGPNNPEWTDPGYSDEIFVKGDAPCVPCNKGICKEKSHLCMEAITVERVCQAAARILDERKSEPQEAKSNLPNSSTTFYVDPAYKSGLDKLGLTSIEAVFAFGAGKNLAKENLAGHRSRIEFQIETPATTLFLKRYDSPPILAQLKNWLAAGKRISSAYVECEAARNLAAAGVNVPKMVAWGEQRGAIFEKRSFVIIEKVKDGISLEKKLPDFFNNPATPENLRMCRKFIRELALFVKKFHDTGYRHRDLYFSHIFWTGGGEFCLIDLARAFRPTIFGSRYRVKDVAQLNYSAADGLFSNTDRMRFYFAYAGRSKLTPRDKDFIGKIIKKTGRIARHDAKRRQKSEQ